MKMNNFQGYLTDVISAETEALIGPEAVLPCLTELSFSSPQQLFICIIKNYNYRIKVSLKQRI